MKNCSRCGGVGKWHNKNSHLSELVYQPEDKKKKVVGWCYKQLHASSTNSFTIHLPSNGQRDDNKKEENKGRNKSHKICDNIYALMLDSYHFTRIGAFFLFTLSTRKKKKWKHPVGSDMEHCNNASTLFVYSSQSKMKKITAQ